MLSVGRNRLLFPCECAIMVKMSGYSVSLLVGKEERKYKGSTLLEIFSQFKPEIVKGKAVLRVKNGSKSVDFPLFPYKLKRLLTSKIFQAIMEKRLNAMLK